MKTPQTYVLSRLSSIQKRFNFNPAVGRKQVRGASAERALAYGQFSELLNLARKFNWGDVPYDPTGHIGTTKPADNKDFVYFARLANTQIYKIGHSKTPYKRVASVQLGNDCRLIVVAVIDGGRELERKIHKLLRRYKTRDAHKTGKGEWFELSQETFEGVIKQCQEEMGPRQRSHLT